MNDDQETDSDSSSDEPQANGHHRGFRNRLIEPTTCRTIIMRDKEIISELLRLGESTGMTIILLSAIGRISYAELTVRGSLVPVTFIHGVHQIEAIYGRIYPPFQTVERHAAVIVNLSGIVGGVARGIRLVSCGDVEVYIHMRREQVAPAPIVPLPREERLIRVTTNRDIFQSLASLSREIGQTIRVIFGTGKVSDATIYSLTRRQQRRNLGCADILQIVGVFRPNGPGQMYVTLSGVIGGTARAYRLIADGDVVLGANLIRETLA